jgi:iron only hydrogenase large subunit-like protein
MNGVTLPYFHSVTLDSDRCVGCTTCIKQCPSEAIRVRKGKAHIVAEKCIDCGECIRVCPHGAKKAVSDSLSAISSFRWKVAIPAPALYSQFEETISVDRILGGLLSLGFDEVFEVAEAAEIVTGATKSLLAMPEESEGSPQRPVISTACPAVVKLVQVRYPSLIPHLAPLIPPMEVAARCVKERLHAGEEGVGVFFISPCAGKVTAARAPLGYKKSYVDGVIGLKDIYLPLRAAVGKGLPEKPLSHAGPAGMAWANSEGEVEALGERRSIAVDGIANVIGVLEAIENGKLKGVAYVEALACPAGCVGGPLTVENPYIARARLGNRTISLIPTAGTRSIEPLADLFWDEPVQARSARLLDPDMLKAMIMLEEIEHLASLLPGLDCGSCGAPSCLALAEDIVRGNAVETDCIFKLRETVRELAGRLLALEELKPPGLDKE